VVKDVKKAHPLCIAGNGNGIGGPLGYQQCFLQRLS
jgi:hypothetical protein